jgi:putative transposase
VVFFLDECHLLWGDICGYVWGKKKERIEVSLVNERQKQTYYGALNFYTQKFLVKTYDKGNSHSTIAFIQYLLAQCPQSRIALIWDGASYHRSQEVRTYARISESGVG